MTALPIIKIEASGSTTPEASAVQEFITITNTAVTELAHLADEIRAADPGTSAVITALAESVAGQAIDAIGRWPGTSRVTIDTESMAAHLGEMFGVDWDCTVMHTEEPHIFRSAFRRARGAQ